MHCMVNSLFPIARGSTNLATDDPEIELCRPRLNRLELTLCLLVEAAEIDNRGAAVLADSDNRGSIDCLFSTAGAMDCLFPRALLLVTFNSGILEVITCSNGNDLNLGEFSSQKQ